MTAPARSDLRLARLDAPGSPFVARGPAVVVGSAPGPGGLQLPGIRGLGAAHCRLEASGASAWVSPLGTHQVRMAPHPQVDFAALEPLAGTTPLSRGCVLYLGPVGRGVALQFLESGPWLAEREASAASSAGPVHSPVQVGVMSALTAAVLGLMLVLAVTLCGVVLLVALVPQLRRPVPPLGVRVEGLEIYDHAAPTQDERVLRGVDAPFLALVVEPSAQAAGRPELLAPERWDRRLRDRVAASVEQHASSRRFFRRLELVRPRYAAVLEAVREAGLPEVFAGIPYDESLYDPAAVSPLCARGIWQLMPEVATRQGLAVRDCRITGRSSPWTPTDPAPPPNAARRAPYVVDGKCGLEECAQDERAHLGKSTRAAMALLREVYDDRVLRDSGGIVPIAILSHHAGYDDARFGPAYAKRTNLRPAFEAWAATRPPEPAWFAGESLACETPQVEGDCGSVLPASTQHYAYGIIARHILATCYYGAHPGDEPALAALGRRAYCDDLLVIPTPEEL